MYYALDMIAMREFAKCLGVLCVALFWAKNLPLEQRSYVAVGSGNVYF